MLSMTRRFFLKAVSALSIARPALLGIPFLVKQKESFLVVNGWILKKSDLEKATR